MVRAQVPRQRAGVRTLRSVATTPTSSSNMCTLTTHAPGLACTFSKALFNVRTQSLGTTTLDLAGRTHTWNGQTVYLCHAEIRRLRTIRSLELRMEASSCLVHLGLSWRIIGSRPWQCVHIHHVWREVVLWTSYFPEHSARWRQHGRRYSLGRGLLWYHRSKQPHRRWSSGSY